MWLDFLTKNSEFILGIIRIVITVLFAYSLVFLVKFLINYLYKKAINTSYIADVAVLLALKKPIILTIWFYCGFIAVNILVNLWFIYFFEANVSQSLFIHIVLLIMLQDNVKFQVYCSIERKKSNKKHPVRSATSTCQYL